MYASRYFTFKNKYFLLWIQYLAIVYRIVDGIFQVIKTGNKKLDFFQAIKGRGP